MKKKEAAGFEEIIEKISSKQLPPKTPSVLHLFGIRHHGPGSARSLLQAFSTCQPDCILIEAPADAEGLLKHLEQHSNFCNPVAMLIYDPKNINRASFFPLAEFSPEWQAIQFGLERKIPVRFMDLPMGLSFAFDIARQEKQQVALDLAEKLSPEERQFHHDPMGALAQLGGYSDSERWWEATFESVENQTEIFAAILEMVTALRETVAKETPETLRRESFMRQTIRQAQKDGFQNIAIVCGAWHTQALADLSKFKASADATLLKGVKKISTVATWVPWSYDRLTFQSGYRAGVISPAWYELLFSEPKEAALRWMIEVARLFRAEDLDASSAHVIEAIRLAETLATLRGLALPGLDELKEAAIGCICGGDWEQLQLIENKLVVGGKVGRVPDNVPTVPLQRDVEQGVKSARLTKYWQNTTEQWLGATANQPRGGIDLREENDRLKSQLLHRLNLLGIPWGTPVEINRHATAGGFKEFWKLRWSPDFAIRIIEMGAWGNTVEAACINFLKKKTSELHDLPQLTGLLRHTLNAQLPAAFATILQKLENIAAVATDVYHLMDALPPLALVVRYGNTRGTNVEAVERLVNHLVPRICISLPGAVILLDEDASKEALSKILAVNRALSLLNRADLLGEWFAALQSISTSPVANGILTGACTRLLFDKQIFSFEETATRMRYALSPANPPLAAAQWLEGFLQGSGLLLIHHATLWNLIDRWVEELGKEVFTDILPLLRRTFSRFRQPERERMLDLAKQGQAVATITEKVDFDEERAKLVLPTVRMLLGI